jgi:hypothetical protein
MTALQFAQESGARVLLGGFDGYHWPTCTIYLRRSVALGTGPIHLLIAAHEVAHHQQNQQRPWLRFLLWFAPVYLCVELEAWGMALNAVTD